MNKFSVKNIRKNINDRVEACNNQDNLTNDERIIAYMVGEYDKQSDEVITLQNRMCHLASVQHLNTVKIFEAGPLEAALARIEEVESELCDWQRYCGIILRQQETTHTGS